MKKTLIYVLLSFILTTGYIIGQTVSLEVTANVQSSGYTFEEVTNRMYCSHGDTVDALKIWLKAGKIHSLDFPILQYPGSGAGVRTTLQPGSVFYALPFPNSLTYFKGSLILFPLKSALSHLLEINTHECIFIQDIPITNEFIFIVSEGTDLSDIDTSKYNIHYLPNGLSDEESSQFIASLIPNENYFKSINELGLTTFAQNFNNARYYFEDFDLNSHHEIKPQLKSLDRDSLGRGIHSLGASYENLLERFPSDDFKISFWSLKYKVDFALSITQLPLDQLPSLEKHLKTLVIWQQNNLSSPLGTFNHEGLKPEHLTCTECEFPNEVIQQYNLLEKNIQQKIQEHASMSFDEVLWKYALNEKPEIQSTEDVSLQKFIENFFEAFGHPYYNPVHLPEKLLIDAAKSYLDFANKAHVSLPVFVQNNEYFLVKIFQLHDEYMEKNGHSPSPDYIAIAIDYIVMRIEQEQANQEL